MVTSLEGFGGRLAAASWLVKFYRRMEEQTRITSSRRSWSARVRGIGNDEIATGGVCAARGEENLEKLVVSSAQEIDYVSVQACDASHHYLKTVDLTKDGHVVPVVDELATITQK